MRSWTLIEALVAVTLAALVLAGALSVLSRTQQHTASALTRRTVESRARNLMSTLRAELRDLNLADADLEPDQPVGVSALDYRLVRGWDEASHTAQLEPSRSSGEFFRIWLSGEKVLRTVDGHDVELAAGVRDLRFDLDATGTLTVRVAIAATDQDGQEVRAVEEATLLLRNRITGPAN